MFRGGVWFFFSPPPGLPHKWGRGKLIDQTAYPLEREG
jgi:hypothetical protein